jgi:hypothetical protein
MTHAFCGQKDLILSLLSFALSFPFPVRPVNKNIQAVANKWKELQPWGYHSHRKEEAHSIQHHRRLKGPKKQLQSSSGGIEPSGVARLNEPNTS